jgi:uncharacterized protein YjbI with pentapeptide repeats
MSVIEPMEVWARLAGKGSLNDLDLPRIEGRVDLRALNAPDPTVIGRRAFPFAQVEELRGIIWLKGVHWKSIDFSRARLRSLRFHHCTIENCRFDDADCQDWRMWETNVVDTSFRSTSLRSATLGGVENDKRNRFIRVDFTKTDLRGTANRSADFIDCLFRDAVLAKVDFQGSVFVNCVFEGELREVAFHHSAFRGEKWPKNEMLNVDFRRAKLRLVEFRRLNMNTVKWPEDDDHILVRDYRASLDRALVVLERRTDPDGRVLAADLAFCRKWAGPEQQVGVLNKRDILEAGGEKELKEVIRLLQPA